MRLDIYNRRIAKWSIFRRSFYTRRIFNPCLISLAAGFLLAAGLGTPAMAKPKQDTGSTTGQVAAIVDGKPIYLESLNSADIAKARRQLYGLERTMLRKVVLEKLRKEKPGEFGNGKIDVTGDDIKKVYKEAGLSSRGTLDSFRNRIHEYLIRTKTEQMEDEQFEDAVRKGYVTSQLAPPPAYLYRLERVNRPGSTRGPENAAVTVVEFSDFQ